MPALSQTTSSPPAFRGCGVLLLVCLLFITCENLVAQPVDTNTAANPAVQTNGVPQEAAPAYPELAATNLTNPFTNAPPSSVFVAPAPYAPPGGSTIGTGQLASPITGTSALTGAPPAAPEAPGAEGLWQAGKVVVHAVLKETLIYGNGLEFTPGSQASTFVNEFSPGVILDLGTNWVLSYAPTIINYSSDKFQNTVNQAESLAGHATYEDWYFGLTQSYARGTVPLVETGEETLSEDFSTALTAGRQLGGDFSVQVSAIQNYRDTQHFDTVAGWTAATTLSYSPLTQLSFNLSASGGYDQINVGSDITFESLQAGLIFRPGSKLKLSLSGGAEELQFINPSAPGLLSPIFNASISYQATQSTLLSANAAESVSPSFYANQVITYTSVAAMIQQQLLNKLSLSVTASYSTSPYTSIEPGPLPQYYLGVAPPRGYLATVRNDTFETVNVALTYLIGKRITSSIFYTWTEDSTGQIDYNFTSVQEGLSLTYRY